MTTQKKSLAPLDYNVHLYLPSAETRGWTDPPEVIRVSLLLGALPATLNSVDVGQHGYLTYILNYRDGDATPDIRRELRAARLSGGLRMYTDVPPSDHGLGADSTHLRHLQFILNRTVKHAMDRRSQ